MVRVIILASVIAAIADAHSSMAVPKPTYPDGFYTGMNPVMRIDGTPFAPDIPAYQGLQKIAVAMKGQSSLKSFIMANAVLTGTGQATKECGWALADGVPQPLPDAVDFPWAHAGPCEVWCDNTKVLYNENCMANGVGKVSLAGKCNGAKMIQAMYVATHLPSWEVYLQCAPIASGGASSTSNTAGNKNSTNTGSSNNSNTGNTSSSNNNSNTSTSTTTTNNNNNTSSNNSNSNTNNSNGNQQSGGNNANNSANNGGNSAGNNGGSTTSGGSNGQQNNGNRNGSGNNYWGGNWGGNNGQRSFDFDELDKRQLRSA